MAPIAERAGRRRPERRGADRGRLLRRVRRQARPVPVPLLAADRLHAAPPPAVAAILSGGLANIGAYGLLRFGGDLLPRELELAATALIVVGRASILYGGVLAVSRRDAREMLAYSAIGQVGYVLVAIGIGGPSDSRAAVLLHDRQRAQQDAAVPRPSSSRRARRRARSRSGPERRRRAARRRVRRQARAVPRPLDAGSVPRWCCCSSAARLSFVYVFQVYQYDFWRDEARRRAGRPRGSRRVPRAARARRRPVARAAARARGPGGRRSDGGGVR